MSKDRQDRAGLSPPSAGLISEERGTPAESTPREGVRSSAAGRKEGQSRTHMGDGKDSMGEGSGGEEAEAESVTQCMRVCLKPANSRI